jgi:23S rRNA A2030 N6-methylase RlmJ
MGELKRKKVRYNPGNLGDLLKHGWLVEIVRFLHQQKNGRPLRYADSFCGFAEYDIDEEMAERIRDRFHVLSFQKLQEPFLARGKYAGSVTLARLAAAGNIRASIYDINPEACASFPAGEAEILEIRAGCDILDSKDPCDLVFLDPYDDIWAVCETVLAKSVALLGHASILVFFPFKTEAQRDFLETAVGRLGVNCQTGIVMNPGSPQDGTFHFAAFFMPGTALNAGAVLGLFGDLNIVTSRVNALTVKP